MTYMNDDDEEERITPVGLARYSYEYIEAANVVDETIGDKNPYLRISPVPAYYLAKHGIELILKSFLRFKGVSVEELRREFGHDLKRTLQKARELGLDDHIRLSQKDNDALDMLIALDDEQGLRYIRTGPKQFPSWAIVYPVAVRLHQAVAPLVGYHSFTAYVTGS